MLQNYNFEILDNTNIQVFSGYFVVDTSIVVTPGYYKVISFYDNSQPGIDVIIVGGYYGNNAFNTTTLEFTYLGVDINPINNAFFQSLTPVGNNQANLYYDSGFSIFDLLIVTGGTLINANSYVDYTFIISLQTPICYARGTKILCESGYVPIEELKPGMPVKTYIHGYKPIELIGKGILTNDPTNWKKCMYVLPKCGKMTEDLIVTGGHGILKGMLSKHDINADSYWFRGNTRYSKIDNMYVQRAAFSKQFKKITTDEEFEYYHFSLKGGSKWTRYGVWANGILSESTFSHDISKCLKLK